MIKRLYVKTGAWLEQRSWGKPVVGHIRKHRRKYELLETVVFVVVVTLLIRGYVIEAYKIPSGSMLPTLHIGDRLFVNKFVYRFRPIEVGDVIVFKVPEDIPNYDPRKPVYIKRVVGLPGDKVAVREGDLYVNGERVIDVPGIAKTEYVNRLSPYLIQDPGEIVDRLRQKDDPVVSHLRKRMAPEVVRLLDADPGGPAEGRRLGESIGSEIVRMIRGQSLYDEDAFAGVRLSGKTSELIVEASSENALIELNRWLLADAIPKGISEPMEVWYSEETVPEGKVFVFGDNSEDSFDSRYWGGVPIENIKGKALFIWWPFSRAQLID